MASARSDILASLRKALAAGPPFPEHLSDNGTRLPVTVLAPDEDLRARFVAEVERVRGTVHGARDQADARVILGGLLAERKTTRITMWDQAHLPVDDIEGLLVTQGITRVQGAIALVETAEAGITACDAAIAATGTLVLSTGPGRSRMASLLPPLHIALVREAQLLPRLEDLGGQPLCQQASGFPQRFEYYVDHGQQPDVGY